MSGLMLLGEVSQRIMKNFYYNGNSYKYTQVPASTRLEIWITFNGSDWYYYNEKYVSISACEDMTFTWSSTGKKSANTCPFVLDIGNGVLVEPILGNKN